MRPYIMIEEAVEVHASLPYMDVKAEVLAQEVPIPAAGDNHCTGI